MVGKISKRTEQLLLKYRNQKAESPGFLERMKSAHRWMNHVASIQWMPRRGIWAFMKQLLPGHHYEGLIHKSGLWILTMLLMSDTRLYTYQIFCQKGWCQPVPNRTARGANIIFILIMPKGKGRKEDIGIMFFKHRPVYKTDRQKQTEKNVLINIKIKAMISNR